MINILNLFSNLTNTNANVANFVHYGKLDITLQTDSERWLLPCCFCQENIYPNRIVYAKFVSEQDVLLNFQSI